MTDEREKKVPEHAEADGQVGTVSGLGVFRIERLLPGSIERAWSYLTDPEKRGSWLGAGEMELRVGGRVQLRFRFDELSAQKTPPGKSKECEVNGRVTRCDPPRLLSYTWGDHPDASEVTFELTPRGPDVLLVISHRRLGKRGEIVSVASGWHTHLGILVDHLNGRQPRPFWWVKARLEAEYEKQLNNLPQP